MSARTLFRTPKGKLILVLIAMTIIAAPFDGAARAWTEVLTSVAVAGVLDLVLLRLRNPRWEFPSGAVLTALIVAMVLSPFAPWWVAAVTSVIAVVSKYIFRIGAANVFNPAALALVIAFHAFGAGQSWWGAMPALSTTGIVMLVIAGTWISSTVNKLPAVLVFLAAYFSLFTIAAWSGDADAVAKIFRVPDIHAALYFALFMLTDPPTAPVNYRDQAVFALIVAASSVALFLAASGIVYYLPGGLLVGNFWEAWRRRRFLRERRQRGH